MGLFDKLFKKKKPAPRRSASQTSYRVTPSYQQQSGTVTQHRPRAPNTYSKPEAHNRGVTGNIPRMSGSASTEATMDRESQKILDESVAKIQTPLPTEQKRQVVVHKRVKKKKKTAKGSSTRPVSPAATQHVIKKPSVSPSSEAKPTAKSSQHLLEDTMGEEELFKKLAQWDKDLKEKVVSRKAKPAADATVAKPVTKKEPVDLKGYAKDLDKREKELKKYEAKLREKEKKIKKMEEMNKLFTQLEDTELEQITQAEVPAEGATGEVSAASAGAGEVGSETIPGMEQEFEELVQPLKTLIFTNFIVGPSNRFAHDVALSVAKAPADAYNPLFIYSQVGLGKTHLLCAIGNYIKSKNPKARIVYASSEKFTNELLDFLREGEMERFRTKYRNVDVLLIDDIQFIGGQEGTQEEFFHTFNSLYNEHKQIVITSDRPPKNIAHLKDRLRSRFEGGLIVNIKPPDLGTRTMILHEKAEKDGIYIPDEIINYIAGKVKSNVRTLIGVLNRVVAHSSLTDRELDTKLVDEVLLDILDEGVDLPSNL